MSLRHRIVRVLLMAQLSLTPLAAYSQASASDANQSNNPLNPAPGLNIQNSYSPNLYGINAHTNDFLLRGTLPMLPSRLIGVPQILRATVPISTRPQADGSYTTGLGDINIFDIFLLNRIGGAEIGVGPLLTIPTATDKELGTGKMAVRLSGSGGRHLQPSQRLVCTVNRYLEL